MKPYKLLLPAVAILAQTTALADGGTVQLRKEAGDLVITVFTSPSRCRLVPSTSACSCRSGMGSIRCWMPNVS